jgi:hypothetical protein
VRTPTRCANAPTARRRWMPSTGSASPPSSAHEACQWRFYLLPVQLVYLLFSAHMPVGPECPWSCRRVHEDILVLFINTQGRYVIWWNEVLKHITGSVPRTGIYSLTFATGKRSWIEILSGAPSSVSSHTQLLYVPPPLFSCVSVVPITVLLVLVYCKNGPKPLAGHWVYVNPCASEVGAFCFCNRVLVCVITVCSVPPCPGSVSHTWRGTQASG